MKIPLINLNRRELEIDDANWAISHAPQHFKKGDAIRFMGINKHKFNRLEKEKKIRTNVCGLYPERHLIQVKTTLNPLSK